MNIDNLAETIDTKFKELKSDFDGLDKRLTKQENPWTSPLRPECEDGETRGYEEQLEFDQLDATKHYIQTGDISQFSKRELSITGGDTGGVMVVPHLSKTIERLLTAYNPIRQNCTVIDNCQSNTFEKIIFVGGTQATRKLELDTRAETATGDFAKVGISLFELSAMPMVTNELVSSTEFNPLEWLPNEVAEAFATKENIEFINGTGATGGEAEGILNYTLSALDDDARAFGELQTVNSGNAGDFDGDDLISLIYKTKLPYRLKAKWYISTEGIEYARKLKDSTGRHLWSDPLSEGQASTLLGYPVVEVAALPGVAADTIPIMFGDMKKAYYVVDNPKHSMIVVDRITKKGWTKVFTTMMSGGGLMDSNALKLLQLSI